MQHIFLDFEMHPIDRRFREDRVIIRNEIIEFGAVMLEENLSEISAFRKYVKPERMIKMAEYIKDLTGITQAELAGADKFADVLESFITWCKSFGEEYMIYAWSKNDLEQIKGELEIKHIEISPEIEELMNNWEDFQVEFCELVKAEKPMNLEKALNEAGIAFDGRMHDALWDSRNTAQLYRETRDKEKFMKEYEAIWARIADENEGSSFYSLGDLFDFSALNLAS